MVFYSSACFFFIIIFLLFLRVLYDLTRLQTTCWERKEFISVFGVCVYANLRLKCAFMHAKVIKVRIIWRRISECAKNKRLPNWLKGDLGRKMKTHFSIIFFLERINYGHYFFLERRRGLDMSIERNYWFTSLKALIKLHVLPTKCALKIKGEARILLWTIITFTGFEKTWKIFLNCYLSINEEKHKTRNCRRSTQWRIDGRLIACITGRIAHISVLPSLIFS